MVCVYALTSRLAPVPEATVHATESTETMTKEAQGVAPIAMDMGCTRGPVTVITTPPAAGEFEGPARE